MITSSHCHAIMLLFGVLCHEELVQSFPAFLKQCIAERSVVSHIKSTKIKNAIRCELCYCSLDLVADRHRCEKNGVALHAQCAVYSQKTIKPTINMHMELIKRFQVKVFYLSPFSLHPFSIQKKMKRCMLFFDCDVLGMLLLQIHESGRRVYDMFRKR